MSFIFPKDISFRAKIETTNGSYEETKNVTCKAVISDNNTIEIKTPCFKNIFDNKKIVLSEKKYNKIDSTKSSQPELKFQYTGKDRSEYGWETIKFNPYDLLTNDRQKFSIKKIRSVGFKQDIYNNWIYGSLKIIGKEINQNKLNIYILFRKGKTSFFGEIYCDDERQVHGRIKLLSQDKTKFYPGEIVSENIVRNKFRSILLPQSPQEEYVNIEVEIGAYDYVPKREKFQIESYREDQGLDIYLKSRSFYVDESDTIRPVSRNRIQNSDPHRELKYKLCNQIENNRWDKAIAVAEELKENDFSFRSDFFLLFDLIQTYYFRIDQLTDEELVDDLEKEGERISLANNFIFYISMMEKLRTSPLEKDNCCLADYLFFKANYFYRISQLYKKQQILNKPILSTEVLSVGANIAVIENTINEKAYYGFKDFIAKIHTPFVGNDKCDKRYEHYALIAIDDLERYYDCK